MAHNETALQTSARRRTVLRGLGASILAATGAGTASSVAAQSNDITVRDIRESPDATLPVVDELLVFVHGWMSSNAGPDQAAALADVLAAGDYEPDETVAFVYDASTPDPVAVLEDAADAGAALADLVQTAVDEASSRFGSSATHLAAASSSRPSPPSRRATSSIPSRRLASLRTARW